MNGNRFDCRSLRDWRRPERRLYTALFFEYFSFRMMWMPITNTRSVVKPVVLRPESPSPALGTDGLHRGAVPLARDAMLEPIRPYPRGQSSTTSKKPVGVPLWTPPAGYATGWRFDVVELALRRIRQSGDAWGAALQPVAPVRVVARRRSRCCAPCLEKAGGLAKRIQYLDSVGVCWSAC